ncbi:MAG: 1-phosphofructokinase [Clostridia bacterium]|nr:1-phosphofructokinase [Clostridia bacterium]
MIYTLTFNPAIDYCVKPVQFAVGQINSCDWNRAYAGGKGINVARVLKQLGAEPTVLGFIAGFTGEAVRQSMADMGIATDFVVLPSGMTRINVKIRCGVETDINCTGPQIDKESLDRLFDRISALQDGDWLILAGSLPAGLPENTYEMLLEALGEKSVTVAADTTGNKLLRILKYRPFVIKPNHVELGELFGCKAESEEEILALARRAQDLGARNVLVSRAEKGALLLTETGEVLKAPLFSGSVVNTVGAGDSMLAGFLCGILQTGDMAYALRLGAAAGAATVFSDDLADRAAIERLL